MRTTHLEESLLPTPEVFEVWSDDNETVFVIPLLSKLEATPAMRQSHHRWSELLDDPVAIKYSAVVVRDPVVDLTWKNVLDLWRKSFDNRSDRRIVRTERPLTSKENRIFERYASLVEWRVPVDLPDIELRPSFEVDELPEPVFEPVKWIQPPELDSSTFFLDEERYPSQKVRLNEIDGALKPLVDWYDASLEQLDDEVLQLGLEYLTTLTNDDESSREELSNASIEGLRRRLRLLFDKIESLDESKVELLSSVVDEAERSDDIECLRKVRSLKVCAAEISKNRLDERIDRILGVPRTEIERV